MFFTVDELSQLEVNALVTKKFLADAKTLNDVIVGYEFLSTFFQADNASNALLFQKLGLLPCTARADVIADKKPVVWLTNEKSTQNIILSEAVHVVRKGQISYLLFGVMDPPNQRTGNFFSLLNVIEKDGCLFERNIGHLQRAEFHQSSLTVGQYARELIKSVEEEIPLENLLRGED